MRVSSNVYFPKSLLSIAKQVSLCKVDLSVKLSPGVMHSAVQY